MAKSKRVSAKSPIWVLVGTRPEVIKQVPLYWALKKQFGADSVRLIGTGQHRELLQQALDHFGEKLDRNLDIMKPGQTLSQSAAEVLSGISAYLESEVPSFVVVQGDTTTAAMAALAAFHHGIPIVHNEAGLRSYDLAHPFPEEANRKIIGTLAQMHMAPTERARQALLKEAVCEAQIFVTGNTGIDALRWTLDRPVTSDVHDLDALARSHHAQLVLLTAHRRENQGAPIDQWFSALRRFVDEHKDLVLVYPMHPNKAGEAAVAKHLKGHERIKLLAAIHYGQTCQILKRCRFVVTDSGGIQEEAATLGVPTVVCRKTTERLEAVDFGIAKLAGTDVDSVMNAMEWAYKKGQSRRPDQWNNVFGDGQSGPRIAEIISQA